MKEDEKEYMSPRVRILKRTASDTGTRYRDLSPIFNSFIDNMIDILIEDGELTIHPLGKLYLSIHRMKNAYDAIRKQRIPELEVLRINYKPSINLKKRVKMSKDQFVENKKKKK
jgi:nucleoid DNA-binding protein